MFDANLLARTLHGHLGLLAAAALLHPAIALRPAGLRPGTRWSVVLATTTLTATYAAGWVLYPGYRSDHRRILLHEAFPLAMAFETKEHLAFHALCLAWTGCALVLLTNEARSRHIARLAFGAAAVLTVGVGALGSVVGAS